MTTARLHWRGLGSDVVKALFYVVLIVACVLLAPEEPMKFIYTEF